MVTTVTGELADAISLPNRASKGKGGGRTIPLHDDLRAALASLIAVRGDKVRLGIVAPKEVPDKVGLPVAAWNSGRDLGRYTWATFGALSVEPFELLGCAPLSIVVVPGVGVPGDVDVQPASTSIVASAAFTATLSVARGNRFVSSISSSISAIFISSPS